jgi:hypothetical protein
MAAMSVRRAMKRHAFKTRRSVHPFFQELGAAAAYHHVLFQPLGDDGGLAPAVVLNIPEGLDSFDYAMKQARKLKARVSFICDTREQAADMAARAANALPRHRRIALEGGEGGLASL